MPASRRSLVRAAAVLAIAAALLACTAGVVDLWLGHEVTLLHATKGPEEQAEWRRLRDARDDPAEIYGQPEGSPLRVIVPRSRLLAPPEAPGRLLLPVERARGEAPLQARVLWGWAGLGCGVLATGALLLAWRARRGRA
ncbi:MAG: hypothetical protein ACKOCB_07330 [Planctomycetia bacterium]